MADQNDQNGMSPAQAAVTGAVVAGAVVAGAAALANPDNQEKIKDAADAAQDAVAEQVEGGKENIKNAAEAVSQTAQDAAAAVKTGVDNI